MREKEEKDMLGKKIVVVDDDENIRKTFFLIFHKKFRVYLAKDGREALDKFKSAKFDLIIADVDLPRLNGLAMIGKFREMGYKGEAILISGHPDMIRLDEMTQYSIGHFFVKPLDLNALNRSIEYLLFIKNQNEKRAGNGAV